MKAIRVGTCFRIPVFIHWSFGFVFLFICYMSYKEEMTCDQTYAFALYIFMVFFCVILHEFGHALTARTYGIRTRDIIISPIGGIARLEGMPDSPMGELMVAIGGPIVNLFIAVAIFIGLYLAGIGIPQPDGYILDVLEILTNPIGFVYLVLLLNVILFLFNLIPAYPMDGGRILRALLSYKMNKRKATMIATTIGRIFAVAFMILAIYNRIPSLFFIGGFVFIAAGREYNAIKQRL